MSSLPRASEPAEPSQSANSTPPSQVDEYKIVRPLGSGTMGQVYKAQDTVLGRSVAIKFLLAENPNEAACERFLIEARAIARVQHPNVLSIFRVGVFNGRPYLVGEFLRGQSLDKVTIPMPWQRVLELSIQISRGLAAAHRRGILHRDIKPANVMITQDGTVKLLDFGLAKLNDCLSKDRLRPVVGDGSLHTSTPSSGIGIDANSFGFASENTSDLTVVPMQEPVAALARMSNGSLGQAETLPVPEPAVSLSPSLDLVRPAAKAASGEKQPSQLPLGSKDRSLTAPGSLMGTPLYMAPEAWRGEQTTAAADIYSLGVLLYELCTGHPPHDYLELEEIYLAANKKDPRPLTEAVPGINPRLAAIIHRCLRRNPEERYSSGTKLRRKLELLSSELQAPSARAVLRQAIRKRWPVALAITTVLLLPPLILVNHYYQERIEQRNAELLIKNRRSVAMLGLVDLSKDARNGGFAAAFSELLGAELVIGEQLRRIPAESVARMKLEVQLPASDTYSTEVLARIRANLGVDLVVAGAIEPDAQHAEQLRIRILVADCQTGAAQASTLVSGSAGQLFELVSNTGSKLREELKLAKLSATQTSALLASRPDSPELAQLYAQGTQLLRTFDAVGARKLLEKVIAADPDFPLAHLAMSQVWGALGYDEKAKLEARRAFEMAGNLAREDRYRIEAHYREATKEWDKAIEIYRTLLSIFPKSLDYGMMLVSAQYRAGQLEAARSGLQKLHTLPSLISQDPRLDILDAKVTADAGDQEAARKLLERAALQGEAIGAPLLVANAQLELAYALSNLGQQEQALAQATAAKTRFTAAGDRGAAADALMAISSAHMYQGDVARGLESAEEALTLLLKIQNSSLIAAHLCNLGIFLAKKGELPLALARAQGGLLLAREIGLVESVGSAFIAIGWISTLQGKIDNALESFQQAESAFNELGDPRMVAWAKWHIAQAMLISGNVAEAKQKHLEALATREKAGLKSFVAESQAALAALALEQHLPVEAEAQARAAALRFIEEQQADNEAWAQALLAESLALQDKREGALQALARARLRVETNQNIAMRLLVRRKVAVLQVSLEKRLDPSQAQRELAELLVEARASGLVVEELEIRLAHYQMLPIKNYNKESIEKVREIANEATAKGIMLISKNANELITNWQQSAAPVK